MKYFRLYPTVKLVNTCKNSCLYDFINGSMIKLDKKASELLNYYKENEIIDETDENIKFFNKLEEMGLGFYTDTIRFEEEFENTDVDIRSVIIPQNNTIGRTFIELGSECNLNCIFCNRDDKLFRKTGCKKWPSYEAKLNIDDWDNILNDLSKLKCNQLCFIGGNPLLRIDYIDKIINISKKYGFKTFVIYSNGTLIDENTVKIIKQNNIILNMQIVSFNNDTLKKIGLDINLGNEIKNNLINLSRLGINIVAQILINKYNENEIDDIKNILINECKIKNISIDYIYKEPSNNYYSKKYLLDMYDKTKTFARVTREKFNSLQVWNSCLKGQLVIREDGQVLICPMMRKSFGNVLENKIYEILSSEEYIKYVNITKNLIEKCNECSYKYNCIDCRAIEISATNNIYGLKYCNLED